MFTCLRVTTLSSIVVITILTASPARSQLIIPSPAASARTIQWNLAKLSQEPLKLIKATPDPAHGQVRFLLEFTREPTLSELFDWEHRGGPVVFRFLDEDGVVLKTVQPRYEGEFIAEKNARIRLLLQMPDEKILTRTRSVVAVD